MAKRMSSSNKARRRKQPELRTGGGRAAKAQRSRERREAVSRSAPKGPVVRIRPAGALGALVTFLLGLAGAGAVAAVGLLLERWNVVGYPDSAWLYASFGLLVMSVAMGRVARGPRDANAWGVLALVIPAGLLAAEAVLGPPCPTGPDCATIGARGEFGLVLSGAIVAVAAFLTWAIARWQYRTAADRRPASGRVRYRSLVVAMIWMLVFPGAVLGVALVGSDILVRDTPRLAAAAADQAEQECFGLNDAPRLVTRAAPEGYNADWRTFAVRRASESRKGIKGHAVPSNWIDASSVYPYEATVSFNESGDLVDISCQRLNPNAGALVAADFDEPAPDSVPFSNKTTAADFLPRFFTQGEAGPTEEGKKFAKEQAKKAAAKKKKQQAAAAKADTAK